MLKGEIDNSTVGKKINLEQLRMKKRLDCSPLTMSTLVFFKVNFYFWSQVGSNLPPRRV